jgi:hypothetical protein
VVHDRGKQLCDAFANMLKEATLRVQMTAFGCSANFRLRV